mgnify:CR=1 FL=1
MDARSVLLEFDVLPARVGISSPQTTFATTPVLRDSISSLKILHASSVPMTAINATAQENVLHAMILTSEY